MVTHSVIIIFLLFPFFKPPSSSLQTIFHTGVGKDIFKTESDFAISWNPSTLSFEQSLSSKPGTEEIFHSLGHLPSFIWSFSFLTYKARKLMPTLKDFVIKIHICKGNSWCMIDACYSLITILLSFTTTLKDR